MIVKGYAYALQFRQPGVKITLVRPGQPPEGMVMPVRSELFGTAVQSNLEYMAFHIPELGCDVVLPSKGVTIVATTGIKMGA